MSTGTFSVLVPFSSFWGWRRRWLGSARLVVGGSPYFSLRVQAIEKGMVSRVGCYSRGARLWMIIRYTCVWVLITTDV